MISLFRISHSTVILVFLYIFTFFLVYHTKWESKRTGSDIFWKQRPRYSSCSSFLKDLDPPLPSLLIDIEVLESIKNKQCGSLFVEKPVKIGVDISHSSESNILNDSRFEVIYFRNDSTKDYLDFESKPRIIIPKAFSTISVGTLRVPTDFEKFSGFWKRAKFRDCTNTNVTRNTPENKEHAIASSGKLAKLRDEMIAHGMFPFLNGGTFLGWYRECSVIPHTSDMDLAVFHENFNVKFVDSLGKGNSHFSLARKFGMLNDSFEITVRAREGHMLPIDIFVMYEGVENGTNVHWVGGVSSDGTKYKYTYPSYDPWCSASLHGHIFWVSCTPLEKVVYEYGEKWYLDHPTSQYSWSSSGHNVKPNGNWTKEQMKKVYNHY